MDKNNSIIGLGLDQLAKQVKGPEAFSIEPTPAPAPEPTPQPTPGQDPAPKPQDANPPIVDPLKIPINISDANARNVDNNIQNPPVPKDTNDASSPFAPFANVLKEQGVIFDEALEGVDLNTIDGLVNAIQKTIEFNAENYRKNYVSQRSEEAQRFIEMIDQGVPIEEAKNVVSVYGSIKQFTPENLSSNKDLQKKAVETYLRTVADMSDDDIKDQIEYFQDTDKLYDKAVGFSSKLKEYYEQEELQKIQQVKQQEELYKKQAEEQIKGLKEKVNGIAEIIPGKPLNDNLKKKLFESITTPVAQDPSTGQYLNKVAQKRMEDPVSFEIKLHYLHELGVFDDKWDGIISSAKSEAVKDLEKALRNNTSQVTGKAPVYSPEKQSDESKSIVDSFKQLKQQLQQTNFKI
jgi:hypothetical protein